MKCQCCSKSAATVQVRDVDEWRTVGVVSICEQCAQVLVPLLHTGGPVMPAADALSLAKEIIEKIEGGVDILDGAKKWEAPELGAATGCPSCGFTVADLQKSGRLGCPACYDHFAPQLDPLLERLHGKAEVTHSGGAPEPVADASRAMRRKRVADLNARMQAAVKEEDYETAAAMRDEIQAIERELTR